MGGGGRGRGRKGRGRKHVTCCGNLQIVKVAVVPENTTLQHFNLVVAASPTVVIRCNTQCIPRHLAGTTRSVVSLDHE